MSSTNDLVEIARDATEPIFERYAKCWADRDPEAIVRLHTEDTIFWLHNGGEQVHGKDVVRRTFAGMFEQFPNFRFEVYRTFFGLDHWVLDWALLCTLPASDGSGTREARWDCIDVVTVTAEGLVSRKDTFIDAAQAARALV
jgi:SnoaL-like domain